MIAIAAAQKLQEMMQELRAKLTSSRITDNSYGYGMSVTKFTHDHPAKAGMEIALEGDGPAIQHIHEIAVVVSLVSDTEIAVRYSFEVGRRSLGSSSVLTRELVRNHDLAPGVAGIIKSVLTQLLLRDIHTVDEMFSSACAVKRVRAAAERPAHVSAEDLYAAFSDIARGTPFLRRNGKELILAVDGMDEGVHHGGDAEILCTIHKEPDRGEDPFGLATFNVTVGPQFAHARLRAHDSKHPLFELKFDLARVPYKPKAVVAALMAAAQRAGAWDKVLEMEYK